MFEMNDFEAAEEPLLEALQTTQSEEGLYKANLALLQVYLKLKKYRLARYYLEKMPLGLDPHNFLFLIDLLGSDLGELYPDKPGEILPLLASGLKSFGSEENGQTIYEALNQFVKQNF